MLRVTVKKVELITMRHSHVLSDFSITELCYVKWNVDSPDGCHYHIPEWRAIEEEIYMRQPKGYVVPGIKEHCKLKKSLYGLKQVPKYWNKTLMIT